MGPRRDPKDSSNSSQQQITTFTTEDQPVWAKRMEEKILERIDDVTSQMSSHAEELAKLKAQTQEKFNDLEYHQRKYNLLIFGLNSKISSTEDCEEVVRTFFEKDLELGAEVSNMIFHNCHPLKKGCIVRFVRFRDKERVLKSLGKLRGKNMKVSVRTDLPKDLREKRTQLLQKVFDLRRNNPDRVLRVAERGMNIQIEEKTAGKWSKLN
jgi:hypothetical protein